MQRSKESTHAAAKRKYLITWTLSLERGELEKISRHPESLDHGLNYVRSMTKGAGLQLYRIVPVEELTRFTHQIPTSARPTGIAIAEAASLEEAKAMVERWVDGLSYGGGSVPVRNYLQYEIHLLMDLGHAGGE